MNVGLVFAQELGALVRHDPDPHRYLCAAVPDGSNGRKVTARDGRVVDPDVSPLGSDVAYVSATAAPLGVLERTPVGGGSPARPAGDVTAAWPAWSAGGKRIFFSSTGTITLGGDLDLYAVASAGGAPVRVVGGPLREAMAAPSPDGSRIAFIRSDPARPTASGGELWIAGPDGEGGFRIFRERSDISHPGWSYDGRTLVFEAGGGIYTVDWIAGPVRGPLAQGTQPELSPDGTRIAFARGGDVWTMSAGGGEEFNVTRSPIAESGPTWQSAAVPTGGDEPCAIVGTVGDDVITGSPYADFVYDQGGNDVYRTLDGDDRVFDAAGSDRFETGEGADRVTLSAGSNVVDGGPGDDWLYGGAAADRILGGGGNDQIFGVRGPDLLFGGPGNDYIEGNRGDDYLDGGLGNDLLYGGLIDGAPANYDGYDVLLGRGGSDRLAGGWQKDRLFGGPGNDRLRGGPHADYLVGEAGADDLGGEGGDDLILARDGTRDRVYGGPGFDRARLDATDRRGGIERRLR